ncbi:hypothetical protein [Butyrivibrio sp. JL13D10]|uniref:hypothetical protein n=1 Tax=Butyrivibrio sp. JL13D10 TaxID=3236815 RepID=UPI0038B55576
MKKRNKLRSLASKALGLTLAFCMALSFCAPLNVEAKKVKTLKVKHLDNYTSRIDYVDSIATTVKKGSYKVKVKTRRGYGMTECYLKFVAPKTNTYRVTVSDLKMYLKNNKSARPFGSFTFNKPNSKTECIEHADNGTGEWSLYVSSNKSRPSIYKPKRTGKIHLDEGEVLYVCISVASDATREKYCTANVKIK